MHASISLCFLLVVEAVGYKGQPLEPLTKFRQTHRKTMDGRLCAAAYVHDSQAFSDCTSAVDPGGASGKEWCYVEEQVANAGTQKWDYCMPRINYADVRRRVGSAFAEKANEIADAVAVVQGLSRETTRLLGEIDTQCK